jgi:hypothetical protein
MPYRNSLPAVAAALFLMAPAATVLAQGAPAADKWHPVAKTDSQEAFVNTSSIVAVGPQLEARVKQNFAQPQPSAKKDKSYLSSRTTYRFDCAQRRVAMKEVRAFAGADLQGEQVQKATSSDKNLQWLDAQERTVFGELLDYVCKATPAR